MIFQERTYSVLLVSAFEKFNASILALFLLVTPDGLAPGDGGQIAPQAALDRVEPAPLQIKIRLLQFLRERRAFYGYSNSMMGVRFGQYWSY